MKKITFPIIIALLVGLVLVLIRNSKDATSSADSRMSSDPVPTKSLKSDQQDPANNSSDRTSRKATEQPLNAKTVKATAAYQEAVAEATAEGGPLPQGEPIVEVSSVETIDDPKEFGGIIIPESVQGIYVPGEQAVLDISAYGKSGTLTPNQVGRFPVMVVVPDGEVALTLSYPDLAEGTSVSLYCADGGLIDGESKLSGTLDANRSIKVSWTGNHNTGYHSVASFVGDDEKLVRFWVGPRALAY